MTRTDATGPAARRLLGEAEREPAQQGSALPPEAWRLARELAALAPAHSPALGQLAAAALYDLRAGSTRTRFGGGAGRRHLRAALAAVLGRPPSEEEQDSLHNLLAQGAPPVLQPAPAAAPLVVEDGALYLYRSYRLEVEVAAQLRRRAVQPTADPAHEPAVKAVLQDSDPPLSPSQAEALAQAIGRPLSVISGGPGTGKTFIVAALLKLFARLGWDLRRVAIAAPTGKAANRIKEALAPTRAALPPGLPEPETLHRLLGARPGGGFSMRADNPLSCRALIVDESSMVDLWLMSALLSALPESAQLILLGDVDQLPSVQAGAILADLAKSATLSPAMLRLRENHRMRADDPDGSQILAAAQAIQRAEPEALGPAQAEPRRAVTELRGRGVELLSGPDMEALRAAFFDRWAARHLNPPGGQVRLTHSYRFLDGRPAEADAATLDGLLRAVERQKILTITKQEGHSTGAEAVNAALHLRLAQRLGGAERFLPGEPVMMTRNDYERGLFNGDQGLILNVALPGRPTEPMAVFSTPEGPQAFALGGLAGALSLSHAMTVHKAQGSEYEAIALILPEREIPLLSRELIYTALTRAKRSVVILGEPELLEAGLQRRVDRDSGLPERIDDGL